MEKPEPTVELVGEGDAKADLTHAFGLVGEWDRRQFRMNGAGRTSPPHRGRKVDWIIAGHWLHEDELAIGEEGRRHRSLIQDGQDRVGGAERRRAAPWRAVDVPDRD